MGGTEAFPELGEHCSDASCKQLDFLPFTCDACSQVFCLDHRSYTAHKCPKSNSKDNTVLVCPLCASGVRTVAGEDPNLTIDRHLRSSCNPSNYDKVMKKPRCGVINCKEVLTTSNKFQCKTCRKNVCLKHRFALDHECRQQQQQQQRQAKFPKTTSDLASRFMQALSFRTGSECKTGSGDGSSSSSSSRFFNQLFQK